MLSPFQRRRSPQIKGSANGRMPNGVIAIVIVGVRRPTMDMLRAANQ